MFLVAESSLPGAPGRLSMALFLAQRGDGDAGGIIDGGWIWLVALFAVLIIGLVFIAVFARYFRLWIQSVTTGAGIGIFDLILMTFQKVNPTVITRSKIMAVQAGLLEGEGITTKALQSHYLAGGNVPLVIRSMIIARKAKITREDSDECQADDQDREQCDEPNPAAADESTSIVVAPLSQ